MPAKAISLAFFFLTLFPHLLSSLALTVFLLNVSFLSSSPSCSFPLPILFPFSLQFSHPFSLPLPLHFVPLFASLLFFLTHVYAVFPFFFPFPPFPFRPFQFPSFLLSLSLFLSLPLVSSSLYLIPSFSFPSLKSSFLYLPLLFSTFLLFHLSSFLFLFLPS